MTVEKAKNAGEFIVHVKEELLIVNGVLQLLYVVLDADDELDDTSFAVLGAKDRIGDLLFYIATHEPEIKTGFEKLRGVAA